MTSKEGEESKYMNEPLKLKWHSLYGQMLQDRKIKEAWLQVKANAGSGGIDKITIEKFAENEQENLDEILRELKMKAYKPSPVRRIYIPKKNGKKRPLGIPTIKDRIVQQVLVNILTPKFEEDIFCPFSNGYRPNRGVDTAMCYIFKRIEEGHDWIYDCDIKGFFDNIPHKNLMKVLNKYIADGTVLDMIWSWLRAGYIEKGKFHPTNSGTPQGGVISPLLANIYLNELDWELIKNKIYFVRYADDFILFAKTEEEVERAGAVAKEVITKLGLEISMEKTKIVNFREDDFTFLGFDFKHWRKNKQGKDYYWIEPSESSLKKFKKNIKDRTQRKLTLPKEVWVRRVNEVITGTVNYYLKVYQAFEHLKSHNIVVNCNLNIMGKKLHAMDSYARERLRMCMIHRHPTVRGAMRMRTKWNIEYFASIGLKPANWIYFNKLYGYTIEQYVNRQMNRNKANYARQLDKYKSEGKVYYTKERLNKISHALSA